MNQPELGKKIVELRKSKGLTQDELVEKCNLNIRTLQRIEYGEVTPRNYTLKIILSALDYSALNLMETKNGRNSILVGIEQFYSYVFDLFNLKTNTMKKITILTIIFSAISFGLFMLTGEIKAQRKTKEVNQSKSTVLSSQEKLVFSNFACNGCFDDNSDIIGRDVRFKLNGVIVSMKLIRLNQETREFNAGYMKGKLFQNKVELSIPKDIFNEGRNEGQFKFSADKIEQSDDKFLLNGNAKIIVTHDYINDTIEANEIIIIQN
jgi:transcriptional regulator with XRE-family HTH domain